MGLSSEQPTSSIGCVVCKQGGGEPCSVVWIVGDPVVGVPANTKSDNFSGLFLQNVDLQKALCVCRVDERWGSPIQKPIGKGGGHLQLCYIICKSKYGAVISEFARVSKVTWSPWRRGERIRGAPPRPPCLRACRRYSWPWPEPWSRVGWE